MYWSKTAAWHSFAVQWYSLAAVSRKVLTLKDARLGPKCTRGGASQCRDTLLNMTKKRFLQSFQEYVLPPTFFCIGVKSKSFETKIWDATHRHSLWKQHLVLEMLPQKAPKRGAAGNPFLFRVTCHAACKDQDAWIRTRTSASPADRKGQGLS